MGFSGVILDGSVTNAKVATGTLSGDRLAAGFNYPGDMTVQQFCAAKSTCPAITGYSLCCYGGYFYGNCGICVCGGLLGAMICGGSGGLCISAYGAFGAAICSFCGTAVCGMSSGPVAGGFYRGSGFECESISLGAAGYGVCACYYCYDSFSCTCKASYAQLAFGDYGVYTPNKAYVGGGLIVVGNAGAVEGSITISAGCMCYYSCGAWHPVTRVC